MDWTELSEFKGIDLYDSFVLSWEHTSNKIVFNLEVSIWPQSTFYSKPEPNEHTCYRKASLSFTGIKEINGLLPIETVKPTIDPDGTSDYGTIEAFAQVINGYSITGEFGVVKILGGELEFIIYT